MTADESIYLEKENPENDAIIDRKYLCLNETIKQFLPPTTTKGEHQFYNLPMIFTIYEDFEKRKQRILADRKKDETFNTWFTIQFFAMGKKLSLDSHYVRFETKETMKYKIQIAAKHGFGGIALDSVNDDDGKEICGKSVFNDLIEINKDLNIY
uniref:Chitinase n=1 Tax=Panagrolaimus sp. ES5 TaxID=591445 RepID=A0AC34GSP4_9BILA